MRLDYNAWRHSFAETSHKADNASTTLARILAFAKDRGVIATNPCEKGSQLHAADQNLRRTRNRIPASGIAYRARLFQTSRLRSQGRLDAQCPITNYRIESHEPRLLGCGMIRDLSGTIRRLYTDPGEYIDCDHAAVRDFARAGVPADASDRTKANLLYKSGARRNPLLPLRQYAHA
ncbi:MAG: hypothetical protein E8A46_29700 [Bradyrhizobium sp.]|uniref:hypothetical protein n=1 Tax=Bradyrhizobium sp. TaxID=376 RepID=UPI001200E013|nr:hypothetical protein [Bradyrhizobium sp.]THD44997.1 MAG: hypothetical protein E8A46_29700 [Bradyrhizobium sp.]